MLCWFYLNPIIYWTVIENKRLGFGGRRSQATLWLHWKQIKKLTLKSPNNYSLLEQSPVANAQDEESLFSFLAISCIIKICFQWISCFHNHLLHIMRLFDTQELWIKTFLTCLSNVLNRDSCAMGIRPGFMNNYARNLNTQSYESNFKSKPNAGQADVSWKLIASNHISAPPSLIEETDLVLIHAFISSQQSWNYTNMSFIACFSDDSSRDALFSW